MIRQPSRFADDDALIEAVVDLVLSERGSASTRMPDDPGPGGMAMTSWIPSWRLQVLLTVAQAHPEVRERLMMKAGG